MKILKKIYRFTVWSHYEEDSDEPYTVDFNFIEDARNAYLQYDSELTLSGSRAYSVIGPDVVNLVELNNSELRKLEVTNNG